MIKKLRAIIKLSQREFAKKYHIPLKTLQNWEQERFSIPGYVLYMLKRLVEIDSKEDKGMTNEMKDFIVAFNEFVEKEGVESLSFKNGILQIASVKEETEEGVIEQVSNTVKIDVKKYVGNKPSKYSDKDKELVFQMYNEGGSIKEIAEGLMISDTTIRKWLKDYSPILPKERYGEQEVFYCNEELNLTIREVLKTKGITELPDKQIGIIENLIDGYDFNSTTKFGQALKNNKVSLSNNIVTELYNLFLENKESNKREVPEGVLSIYE